MRCTAALLHLTMLGRLSVHVCAHGAARTLSLSPAASFPGAALRGLPEYPGLPERSFMRCSCQVILSALGFRAHPGVVRGASQLHRHPQLMFPIVYVQGPHHRCQASSRPFADRAGGTRQVIRALYSSQIVPSAGSRARNIVVGLKGPDEPLAGGFMMHSITGSQEDGPGIEIDATSIREGSLVQFHVLDQARCRSELDAFLEVSRLS